MMLLGHVIGGLALFGGSILAATAAVLLAGFTGRCATCAAWSAACSPSNDFNEHNTTEHDLTERNSQVFQLGRDDYTYSR